MDHQQIKNIVLAAIEELTKNDAFLLKNNISERSISHKLAVYLNDKFEGYDVDCEYNGYANADNNKKYIIILRERAESLGILRDSDNGDELIKRYVYPDIIIHKRGENDNFLIIEIKKSNSQVDINFDKEKIQRYTSAEDENDLKYNLGAFIVLPTGADDTFYSIEWYENGNQIEIE